MNTWWSALDIEHTSYLEIKYRKVLAQGWSALGNLVSLLPLVPDHWEKFVQVIQLLGDVAYSNEAWWQENDRKEHRTPTVMWNLLDIRKGDLVIAIEGTNVRGICQVPEDGVKSYQYAPAYEYAQTVGFPVEWVDWDASMFGFTPTPPSRGVLGIAGLVQDSAQVIGAWNRLVQSRA